MGTVYLRQSHRMILPQCYQTHYFLYLPHATVPYKTDPLWPANPETVLLHYATQCYSSLFLECHSVVFWTITQCYISWNVMQWYRSWTVTQCYSFLNVTQSYRSWNVTYCYSSWKVTHCYSSWNVTLCCSLRNITQCYRLCTFIHFTAHGMLHTVTAFGLLHNATTPELSHNVTVNRMSLVSSKLCPNAGWDRRDLCIPVCPLNCVQTLGETDETSVFQCVL